MWITFLFISVKGYLFRLLYPTVFIFKADDVVLIEFAKGYLKHLTFDTGTSKRINV